MKKRVLFVQDKLSYGGTTSLIMFITKKLSDKFTFDLFCYEDNDPNLEKEFLSFGGKIIKANFHLNRRTRFGKIALYFFRIFGIFTGKFRRIIKKDNQYDYVHCFEEQLSAYYLKGAAKLHITNRFIHFCNNHKEKRKTNFINSYLVKKEYAIINKYATKILADGENSFSDLLVRNKRFLIPDPIDEKFVLSTKTPSDFTLIQVGSICDNKNQKFSLEVFKNLLMMEPSANLLLMGQNQDASNPYFLEIKEFINENGLNDNVSFIKASPQVNEYFEKSSAMIFPSKKESFGLVLIEAQACGLHCFSSTAASKGTNCGGVEYIELSEGPSEWAKRIYASFKKGNCKKQQLDVTLYSAENVARKFREVYESI